MLTSVNGSARPRSSQAQADWSWLNKVGLEGLKIMGGGPPPLLGPVGVYVRKVAHLVRWSAVARLARLVVLSEIELS